MVDVLPALQRAAEVLLYHRPVLHDGDRVRPRAADEHAVALMQRARAVRRLLPFSSARIALTPHATPVHVAIWLARRMHEPFAPIPGAGDRVRLERFPPQLLVTAPTATLAAL